MLVSQEWLSKRFILAALSEAGKNGVFSGAASAALEIFRVFAGDWVAEVASVHQDPTYLASLYQFRVDGKFYRKKSVRGVLESIDSFRKCRSLVSGVYVKIGGAVIAIWIDESTESIVGLMVFDEM